MEHNIYMRKAIELAIENVKVGGGPFGAVIVKNGLVIAEAANGVVRDNDPTAHAEVSAIREACKSLGTFDLSGCVIYTSCEPCPMCLGAIYWAHIDTVYYGSKAADANNIGFDDSFIYHEIAKPHPERRIKFIELLPNEAINAFKAWDNLDNKNTY